MEVSRPPEEVRFGAYEIRPSTQELFKHGLRVKLPPQAFQVLQLLLERPGQVVSREELHRALWPADTFVDFDHGLNNAVKKIRDVLSDSAEKPRYIETLPKLGYRFIGTIDPLPVSRVVEPIAPPVRRRWQGFRLGLWSTLALLTVGGLFFLLRESEPPRIVATKQLTSDGLDKVGTIVTDGIRVYFTEIINHHPRVVSVPASGGAVTQIATPFPDAVLVNISPDRSELLVAQGEILDDNQLWIVSPLSETPRKLSGVKAHSASWSPDGSRLAYTNQGDVFVSKADGTEPRKLFPADPDINVWAWSPTWSPDGQRLRFARYSMHRHSSQIFETTAEGKDLHPWQPPGASHLSQCCGVWTPDRRYYLFNGWRELEGGAPLAPAANLWAVREPRILSPSQPSVELTTGPLHFFVLAVSPDGKTIFSQSTERRGELMHYDSRAQRLVPFMGGISAAGIEFSPDRKMVAYVKYPQGELWRSRVDGSDPIQLSYRPLSTLEPKWSHDGRYITFAGQTVGTSYRPYIVPSDGSAAARPVWKAGVNAMFSPDDQSLLFVNLEHDDNPQMMFLDLKSGSISPVPGSEGLGSARWSPDGRYISAIRYGNDVPRLMLFDTETRKWTEQARIAAFSQRWSQDSKYLYFVEDLEASRILRISISDNKITQVLDLKNVREADPYGQWFSLGLEDEPIILRNTGGGTEIYALSLDAP